MKKNLIVSLLLIMCLNLSGLFGNFFISTASAATGSYNFNNSTGLNSAANQAGFNVATPLNIDGIIGLVILAGLGLVGVVFLILIVYGGTTWMTAHGNDEKVKKATDIIMGSLLGLMITLAAYSIVYFVINAL